MVNPSDCTNFERSDSELQEFAIFCICVANKNADQIAPKVHSLLQHCDGVTPFSFLREHRPALNSLLKLEKLSPYSQRAKAIDGILNVDIRTCSKDDLLLIPGIGPKTARYFLLHSRKDADHAVLDTHHMRLLAMHGVVSPRKAPTQERQYVEVEKLHQKFRTKVAPHLSAAEFDLIVWKAMSKRMDMVPSWLLP